MITDKMTLKLKKIIIIINMKLNEKVQFKTKGKKMFFCFYIVLMVSKENKQRKKNCPVNQNITGESIDISVRRFTAKDL